MAQKKKTDEPGPRSFRLAETTGDDQVNGVSFGSSPRITLRAGDTFETEDQRLADRLAADPLIEEIS